MENIKHWSVFQKISFGILFIMPFVFLAVFWTGRGDAQTSTAYSPSIPTCSFSYSAWSDCQSNGQQTRNITGHSPSGCVGGTQESLSRSCTYTSPVVNSPICVFSYSSWGNCQSSGMQFRQVAGQNPSGCVGGTMESLSKTCTYVSTTVNTATTNNTSATSATSTTAANPINCSYAYANWTNCDSSGHQKRAVNSASPSGCSGTPETNRSCAYVPTTASSATSDSSQTTAVTSNCSYQCSSWSVCSPAGIKYQSCRPSASGCPGETKTFTQTCAPLKCKFTYSDWGSCTNSLQFRNILTSGPVNCVGGEPVLTQTCSASMSEVNISREAEVIPVTTAFDPDISVNDNWKKETFKTVTCQEKTCGGNADPDNDGLSNNDEFRYGTDPLNQDTDRDGKTDGKEIANGSDPLKSSAKGEGDEMVFENPKEKGTVKEAIYQVTKVEMVEVKKGEKKQIKITGKGPANSYVTVYVYSGQPVIVTVKTDSNGDWTYTVDKKLEDGNHQVYVAVTNNSGAIKAKSAPLPFVKTAQAVMVSKATGNNPVQVAATTKNGMNLKNLLFIVGLSFFGVAFAVIVIGLAMRRLAKKPN